MSGGSDRRLRDAFEAIDRAHGAATVEDLNAIMGRAFAAYGIAHYSLDQMRDTSGALVGFHHFGNPERVWSAHYVEEEHYNHDAIIRHALSSSTPMWWCDLKGDKRIEGAEAEVFGEASEFGLRDGFVTPIHQIDGSSAAVTLTAPEALELSLADQAALRLLSLHYCAYGLTLTYAKRSPDGKPPLTKRQRECLQWVRAGKSSWDISVILGISERTVIFHIDEACRRLGVQTRQQAVIEAIVRKMIAL